LSPSQEQNLEREKMQLARLVERQSKVGMDLKRLKMAREDIDEYLAE
jgi:hypothetical protein